jgi:protein-S-isoprenylcysteine O-methyltransferase Ste14
MHGEVETSMTTRYIILIAHVIILNFVTWIYFFGGIEIIGLLSGLPLYPGNLTRRIILLSFGIIYFLRVILTLFYLLKRKIDLKETGAIIGGLIFYQVGFALTGATQSALVDPIDYVAIGIFIIGSFLNTGSEYQRKLFKDIPENKGKLYTGGLFRFARHINYFGDTVWIIGWALMTRNLFSAIMPILGILGFVFANIPMLSKHLEERYKEQYREWARRTKKFIPFVY